MVAVAMGERPTGGYQVDVVDAELRGSTLRLLVGERTPRPGTFQIQQTTQPFIFVAFPAVKGSVSFKTVAESALPKAQGPGLGRAVGVGV